MDCYSAGVLDNPRNLHGSWRSCLQLASLGLGLLFLDMFFSFAAPEKFCASSFSKTFFSTGKAPAVSLQLAQRNNQETSQVIFNKIITMAMIMIAIAMTAMVAMAMIMVIMIAILIDGGSGSDYSGYDLFC